MWPFRRRRAARDRRRAWSALVRRLEFRPVETDAAEALQERLGLAEGALEGVAVLRREGQPRLTVFEHVATGAGRRNASRAHVLVEAPDGVSRWSWRAFARPHEVLADLQASRAGGRVIATGDDAFDAAVTVVARDGEPVEGTFTPPVRRAVQRVLARGGDEAPEAPPDADLTAGAAHLLWAARTSMEPPFEAVEGVLSGLLTVYAALPRPER